MKNENNVFQNVAMIKILVYDDDPEIRYGIYNYLKSNYEVYITKNIKDVYNTFNQTNINIVIFDCLLIEDINKFINEIKEIDNKVSTIALSSLIEIEEKKKLFNTNIDDYIEKPFDMSELLFRIERLLRKQSNQYRKIIETDNLLINCETNTLTYKKQEYEFFNKEFQILYQLFSYPNKIFSKNELIELLCDNDDYINENTIRTYINALRKKISKINELEIITVRGVGYKGTIKNSSE